MTWHLGPLLGADTETTGVDPGTARIVTACVQLVGDGSGWTKTWLSDAGGEEIPAGATAIHGVTTEQARENGQPVADVAREISAIFSEAKEKEIPLVLFNAAFDLTIINTELARAGSEPLDIGIVIDPMVIDRAIAKYRKGKRTLTDLCKHYEVRQGEAHTADGDVISTLRLAWKLGNSATLGTASEERGKALASLSLSDLMTAQGQWHQEWAEHFRDYLTKQGKDASDVSDAWPVRGMAAAA